MYEWMNKAQCKDRDPALFFPKGEGAARLAEQAINICAWCPVIVDCRRFRKDAGAFSGVWHGQWFKSKSSSPDALKKDGLHMAREGMSVAEIAEELEVAPERVARWIRRDRTILMGEESA